MEAKKQSYWWWFDSHNSSRRSQWLQSTLAELDQKTKAMLKLIDEDADSFAQRAEMYYKKRPELISMVEEFYRAHRSLAERYEQLKSDPGTRLGSPLGHYSSSPKSLLQKVSSNLHRHYDDPEDSGDSEIDDPEDTPVGKGEIEREEGPFLVDYEEVKKLMEQITRLKEENELQNQMIQREGKVQQELRALLVVRGNGLRKLKEEKESLVALKTMTTVQRKSEKSEEMKKLMEDIERLREENANQKEQLMQKDEEKREVIRQLSVAVEMLREENLLLKKSIAKQTPKKKNLLEPYRFKGLGKLFSFLPKSQTSIVPL
ncbi:hypothetical protein Dimus_016073 [Dionaea muscipula]